MKNKTAKVRRFINRKENSKIYLLYLAFQLLYASKIKLQYSF